MKREGKQRGDGDEKNDVDLREVLFFLSRGKKSSSDGDTKKIRDKNGAGMEKQGFSKIPAYGRR